MEQATINYEYEIEEENIDKLKKGKKEYDSNEEDDDKKELIVIDNINPLSIFGKENGTQQIVDKIKQAVEEEPCDISTKEGRTKMRSFARYKIGSSKSALKNMSSKLTEDWRRKTKLVTKETTRMEKEIDKIRDDFLKPLIEFEEKEKNRIEAHEKSLMEMKNILDIDVFDERNSKDLSDDIRKLDSIFDSRVWEEFYNRAALIYEETKKELELKISRRIKYEEEQKELEKLRIEKAEREAKEERERIAREAAERARKEAEDKAKIEVEKAKKEAEKREAMVKAELERIKNEDKKKEDERKRRESDIKHREDVNRKVINAIEDIINNINEDKNISEEILSKIIQGNIPNVRIEY